MAGILAIVILGIYMFRKSTPEQDAAGLEKSTLTFIMALSFLLGAVRSGIAGYIGMWVRANVRVSSAARRSAREALLVALRAGRALIVVGMTIVGVSVLFASFYVLLGAFRFGASFVALLAQLVYTKAADVGADLVGKMEQGILKDDARNLAVIADPVGDNMGGCVARGANEFESIAAEIISATILRGTMDKHCKLDGQFAYLGIQRTLMSMTTTIMAPKKSLYTFTSTIERNETVRRWRVDPAITYVHEENADVENVPNYSMQFEEFAIEIRNFRTVYQYMST